MQKTNEIPERNNIPDKFKWNLEAIYKNFDEWQEKFNDISEKVISLKNNYEGKLKDGAEILLKFLKDDEAVSLELNKLRFKNYQAYGISWAF